LDLWVPWVAAVEPREAFDVSNGTAEEDHVAKVSLAEPAAGDLLVAASGMFAREPALSSILSIDVSRIRSEAELLASVLSSAMVASSSRTIVHEIAFAMFDKDETARNSALADIRTTTRKNFEPGGDVTTLFFSRGVHALLGHRVTHSLGRRNVAISLLASRRFLVEHSRPTSIRRRGSDRVSGSITAWALWRVRL
jgi:hypothetical protein